MQQRFFRPRAAIWLSGTALLTTLPLLSGQALAACSFAPPTGNDAYVCDSGTSAGGLTDLGGNNSLLLPEGGTGVIDGSVTFGPGSDSIEIHSGTITGSVQQGSGVDDFVMTGGVIQSLNQGDNLDTFSMSGGRIIDAFDDGDRAVMTGGRIGRVNMKLDDNLFDMSGGTIDRNLVTGFGNDTIILSDGVIGGNISVSGGTDSVTITGGSVAGSVLMSFGTDTFTWQDGGIVYGTVDLGGDDDTATLANLTNANLGGTEGITGGAGTDSLSLDNVSLDGVARLQNWESIDATNDTELTFDGTLVLGDSATGTGTLNVDSTSTLYGGGANGGISSFTAGQFANVVNAGRIDLTNGGDSTSDTFTIAGNYTGDDGLVFLQTELGDDSSASDKLVISGGSASGTTSLNILNVGGTGAATTQDGILVVEAVNGGTTTGGAFALGNRVAAGAYEYFLFRGGVSGGTDENWYLRSTLTPAARVAGVPSSINQVPQPVEPEPEPAPPPAAPPAPPPPPEATPGNPDPVDPAPPVEADDPAPPAPPAPEEADAPTPPAPAPDVAIVPPPIPTAGAVPPTPGATPVTGDNVALYRIEVPTYAVVPPAAHHLAMSALGTFHERRGEQVLLRGPGYLPASWARAYGQQAETKWEGTVAPSFDGDLFGLQAGLDLIGRESGNGHQDRAGLFVGHSRMSGDVRGQALGWNDLLVGDLELEGTSFGGYWTHIAPNGWYLDGVVMGTWFDGDATATNANGIDIEGSGITVSLEGGYPIAVGQQWTLEPQAQLIWQRLSFDDRDDGISSIAFDSDGAVTGRLGFRLYGDLPNSGMSLQPFVKANLWHTFSGEDEISFGGDPMVSELEGTALEVGGGLLAKLSDSTSLFFGGDYTTNVGGEDKEVFEGNLGLSIKW